MPSRQTGVCAPVSTSLAGGIDLVVRRLNRTGDLIQLVIGSVERVDSGLRLFAFLAGLEPFGHGVESLLLFVLHSLDTLAQVFDREDDIGQLIADFTKRLAAFVVHVSSPAGLAVWARGPQSTRHVLWGPRRLAARSSHSVGNLKASSPLGPKRGLLRNPCRMLPRF